jgi:ribonuclease BN (tRNA processing enzyme)
MELKGSLMFRYLLLLLLMTFFTYGSQVTLQVLGSGGPESRDKRASSSYLIWIDKKSKILIDFGGGASLRFEEVGAKIEDLDVILLTHLHADHTADLPALIKSSFFTNASGRLHIFGPDANFFMPSSKKFIDRLFLDNKGAWQYLGDHLDGSARLQLKTYDIDPTRAVKVIYKDGKVRISAISVHHGPIPAVAYRVDIGEKSITFSGDMSGSYKTLEKLAKNTDILLAHNAVPKGTKGTARELHMTPDEIGRIALISRAKKVVLSHRMLRTIGREHETKKEIRKHFKGVVTFANDKSRYSVK